MNSYMKQMWMVLGLLLFIAHAENQEYPAQASQYSHEEALRMWRLNTLTYCTQESLSVR